MPPIIPPPGFQLEQDDSRPAGSQLGVPPAGFQLEVKPPQRFQLEQKPAAEKIVPPAGFQLEQHNSFGHRDPAGFQLEQNKPFDKRPAGFQDENSARNTVVPPAGFVLEKTSPAPEAQLSPRRRQSRPAPSASSTRAASATPAQPDQDKQTVDLFTRELSRFAPDPAPAKPPSLVAGQPNSQRLHRPNPPATPLAPSLAAAPQKIGRFAYYRNAGGGRLQGSNDKTIWEDLHGDDNQFATQWLEQNDPEIKRLNAPGPLLSRAPTSGLTIQAPPEETALRQAQAAFAAARNPQERAAAAARYVEALKADSRSRLGRAVHPYWLDYAFRSPSHPYTGPKQYGEGGEEQQFFHLEELVDPHQNPKLYGALEAASKIITPQNLAIMAAAGAAGETAAFFLRLPYALTAKFAKMGLSTYFAFQMGRGLYEKNKAFHDRIDHINLLSEQLKYTDDPSTAMELTQQIQSEQEEAERLFGGALIEGPMFGLTAFHAGKGAYETGQEIIGKPDYEKLRQEAQRPAVPAPPARTEAATPQNPTREAAQLLRRYDERVGNKPKPKPQAPSKPPGPDHLTPQSVQQFTTNLASLPEVQRGNAMAQAHQMMTAWMLDRIGKSWMGPDHKLHVVHSPEEAEKLALEFINDQVDLHDKRLAEAQKIPSGARNPYSNDVAQPQGRTQGLPSIRPDVGAQQVVRSRLAEIIHKPEHSRSEVLPAGSSEEPARIDPNFRLNGYTANMMHYDVMPGQGPIPPLIRLNHFAYQVVAQAYGRPVDGLNLPLEKVQEVISSLRQRAAIEPSQLIRTKLEDLASTLDQNTTQKHGLSFVREMGRTEAEFRAIQEELFHAVAQRSAGEGSIVAGTPHEAFLSDPYLQKMQPRLVSEGVTDHVSRVAEAMHDIWANEAVELTPDEQSAFAEKYWLELARKVGDQALNDIPELWQYLQDLARNQYNINANEVMNDRVYQALQRVVARRTRAQSEAVQGTDQPTHPRVLPQHRGRQEAQGDSGQAEEPEGQSGTEPRGIERPPSTGQYILLPNGPAPIEHISPAMNVAVVRLPDGRLRTIKLSQIQNTPPRAAVPHVPEMGRNMTTDSPAVRKVQAESEPVPGQVPQVKVKQEPPQVKTELARPPVPVRAEEAARIGQPDRQSGRTILQPSNDVIQNERLATQAAPDLTTQLSRMAASVPGAKFDRLRPQKGLERLQEKVASGKPPRTIGDNLAAQIVANTVEAKDQLIAHLQREFPVISVDDQFTQLGRKAGYPSANVQVQMPNGGTAEVQIVTPEIQAITDQTHALYTAG